MKVQSIKIINFEKDLTSADVIIRTDDMECYTARINHIDFLLQKIEHGKSLHAKSNYIYVPNSLIVDDINEDYMFDMVNNLLDDGDFHNVFKKV